jgi:hypothetical protein
MGKEVTIVRNARKGHNKGQVLQSNIRRSPSVIVVQQPAISAAFYPIWARKPCREQFSGSCAWGPISGTTKPTDFL